MAQSDSSRYIRAGFVLRGPRMDNIFDIENSALKTVKRVVDRIRPAVYLTIHNWTPKFSDGLLFGQHEPVAAQP